MLLIKLLSLSLRQPNHLHIADGKTRLLDQVDDLAGLEVTVGFYHGEGLYFF
jgi:hypothetical protein